jgi:mRNA interferase MazF
MRQGEIRWYKFTNPDKKRPVLILTRDSIIDYLNEITIAPLTTTIRDIPSEIQLSIHDGVPQQSAINCDHLQTVSKSKIGALITTIGSQKMDEVREAIRFVFDQ